MDGRKELLHVVYAANDGFVRHLGTSLYSLLEHLGENEEAVIYVLSMGISEENQEKLKNMVSPFNCRLDTLELGDLKERFGGEVEGGGFDISIFGRFFVGELLPEEVTRVLYLDCDTVILRPLSALWRTDLRGNILGAVMEPTIYKEVKAQIGLKAEQPYYNSGVLLIDLEAWRREQVLKQLLSFYGQRKGELLAGDQDTLNGALAGWIRALSPRYNFFTNYRYFHYKDLVRLSPSYGRISRALFQKAKKYPVVVHYMGDERPWKAGNLNHYRRAYEAALSKTPWAGTPKEEGQRLYLWMYHIMDYMTFLCPPSRRIISAGFGMKAIRSRKAGTKK